MLVLCFPAHIVNWCFLDLLVWPYLHVFFCLLRTLFHWLSWCFYPKWQVQTCGYKLKTPRITQVCQTSLNMLNCFMCYWVCLSRCSLNRWVFSLNRWVSSLNRWVFCRVSAVLMSMRSLFHHWEPQNLIVLWPHFPVNAFNLSKTMNADHFLE